MIKDFSLNSWDFGQAPFNIVKVARLGFRGNDMRDFIKQAGDEAAHRVRMLDQHARPNEQLVHLLAMGATEVISPNRNGDGWKRAILLDSYPSFTKYAHWHRNHKVEEDDGVYGKVRDSWFNHKMGRVELLCGLFENMEAARAGHAKRGKAADKEIQILDSGRELPISMSGYVPYDTCSSCQNKARGRKEYCKGASCKHGGLYDNIGRVFEDGHHLHADNPKTRFFDISGIFDEHTLQPDRQADRIAYSLGRVKSGSVLKQALEDSVLMPWWLQESNTLWGDRQSKTLQAMLGFEKQSSLTYHGTALDTDAPKDGLENKATMRYLQKMARQGVCLSLPDFATLCGAGANLATSAEPYAKTALSRMAQNPDLQNLLDQNPFRFEGVFQDEAQGKALFSMSPDSVRKRAWLDADYQETTPAVPLPEGTASEALADLHALYRLGFATSLEKSSKLDLLLNSTARHNRSH